MKKLVLGFFVLTFLSLGSTVIIEEIQQDRAFTPKDLTSDFTLDLDCDASFDVTVDKFSGPSGQKAFCTAYPSEITSKIHWNGSIPVGTSFDNIAYYDGYFFLLDSSSWQVLVASNLTDASTYKYIEINSDLNHQKNNNIPFLVIDESNKVLFILRSDMAVRYDLISFSSAIKSNATIPKITKHIENWKPYNTIKAAKYYNKNIHLIVDENILEVWRIDKGSLILDTKPFGTKFFGVDTVDIADIAFKGDYAFVLDELFGIYVVNVADHLNYTYVSKSTIKIPDARLLEVTGDSLNVVTVDRRGTFLYEYAMNLASDNNKLSFNRKIELPDAVRSSFSDTNFLYFMSGSQNMVTKHSIPKDYDTEPLRNGYTTGWPLSNIGASISHANGSISHVVILQKAKMTIYEFSETKATLRCSAGNYHPGTYSYHIQSMQRTCKAKTTSSTSDVCRVRQTVAITIEAGIAQVSVPETNDKTGLIVGLLIALLTIAVIVFAYWYFRIRKKDSSPTVRNDVFFRRLSRSPLTADHSSNMYKVTMDIDRSGVSPDGKKDEIIIDGMRKKSDDFVLGPQRSEDFVLGAQRSDDAEESPKRAPIIRGKTFSELEFPRKKAQAPKINTISNIEGTAKTYEDDL